MPALPAHPAALLLLRLAPAPSSTTGRRCFVSSPTSLKAAKAARTPVFLRQTSTRKFVEELRRRDEFGNVTARYGQASRAFSPQLPKPFASLDRWPPPASYRSKGHHKPAMTQTSLRQKPALREVASEAELFKGWTHVGPPDADARALAQTLKTRGFKKVKHFAGGVSGGAPGWIRDKEQSRLAQNARGGGEREAAESAGDGWRDESDDQGWDSNRRGRTDGRAAERARDPRPTRPSRDERFDDRDRRQRDGPSRQR